MQRYTNCANPESVEFLDMHASWRRRKFDGVSDVPSALDWLSERNLHQFHSLTLIKEIVHL